MDWRAILIDSISRKNLSLSLSLARWQLLNKLKVGCVFEGISVPRYRIFIHLPTYRCHRSSRPSSLRMDDERRGKQRNGTTMFKRLAFWRPNRFDHLYLVSHRSRWKERKGGSLIIPDIGRPIILLANLNFFFFFWWKFGIISFRWKYFFEIYSFFKVPAFFPSEWERERERINIWIFIQFCHSPLESNIFQKLFRRALKKILSLPPQEKSC